LFFEHFGRNGRARGVSDGAKNQSRQGVKTEDQSQPQGSAQIQKDIKQSSWRDPLGDLNHSCQGKLQPQQEEQKHDAYFGAPVYGLVSRKDKDGPSTQQDIDEHRREAKLIGAETHPEKGEKDQPDQEKKRQMEHEKASIFWGTEDQILQRLSSDLV
jgi:hypothetical protein